MERSESVSELIAALAKAQAEFSPAIKEVTNSAFGADRTYKYADLAANITAVRPALNKHGIALMQFPEVDLEHQTVSVTTALHHGDQFITQTFEAPAVGGKGFNVQSIGAATTYLRRYGLQALCGLASEDDDGNSVATDNKPIAKKKYRQASEVAPEYVPSDEPEPILKKENPPPTERDVWTAAMKEAATIEEFNTQIVPLAKERGREFVLAMAAEAKRRGYLVDRASGLYLEVAA